MISGIRTALSGLFAFQKKVESTANNVANIETDGYKRTEVLLQAGEPSGVTTQVRRIEDPGPLVAKAATGGEIMVEKSNVELEREIPNLLISRRFYEANLKTIQTEDEMLGSLLDIKS